MGDWCNTNKRRVLFLKEVSNFKVDIKNGEAAEGTVHFKERTRFKKHEAQPQSKRCYTFDGVRRYRKKKSVEEMEGNISRLEENLENVQ